MLTTRRYDIARTLADLTRDNRFTGIRLIRGGQAAPDRVALVPTLAHLRTHPEPFDALPSSTQAALYGVVAALDG
jgi:hypothetical protein